MLLSIGELAKLMGISVRTLRYYDAIGLLRPSAVTPAGYRSYDERAMETLQQILFFRELGFPLSEIGEILKHPEYDKRQALKRRRELLLLERARLDALLQIVENTLEGRAMKKAGVTAQQIQSRKREYAAEARERWGKTEAYREWEEKSRRQSPEKKAEAQRAESGRRDFRRFRGDPGPKSRQSGSAGDGEKMAGYCHKILLYLHKRNISRLGADVCRRSAVPGNLRRLWRGNRRVYEQGHSHILRKRQVISLLKRKKNASHADGHPRGSVYLMRKWESPIIHHLTVGCSPPG